MQDKIDAIVKPKKANRPKKRKKDTDEDVLDRFADEEVSQLRDDMLKAAAEDDEANRDKLPATGKLKLLPRVKEVLQKCVSVLSLLPWTKFEILAGLPLRSRSWTTTCLKAFGAGSNPFLTALSPR